MSTDGQIEGIAQGQGANKDQYLLYDLLTWHVKLQSVYPYNTAIYVRSVILGLSMQVYLHFQVISTFSSFVVFAFLSQLPYSN